jgi:serine/threonine-protein kinase
MNTDRYLLFGILALQNNFLSDQDLIAALKAWLLDKAKPLGQLLLDQGYLTPRQHDLVEALVQEHLQLHHGDAQESLSALAPLPARYAPLQRLIGLSDDADLHDSLSRLSTDNGREGAAPPATPTPAGEAPTVALRYQVLRPHARGGLGEVFVARDQELDRQVALKEIQLDFAHDPHSRSRFLLEAQITGGLEHPGVVPVYGLGRYNDGRPYYAMRFIEGVTLKEAVQQFHDADVPGRDRGERSLALRQLLTRFVAVCNAVAYAHSRGVVHRDIKPANVMLGKFGETLVVDWGLAKTIGRPDSAPDAAEATLRPSTSGGVAATESGAVKGTPAYMSPEQAAGQPEQVGPASDIYSLGATLYTLLTGKAPFAGANVYQVLEKVRRGDILLPRQVKRAVPRALEAICQKAMALKPEARYATAQVLAADVEHWLADEPVVAYREPLRSRASRLVRKRPGLAGSVLVGVGLAAVFLAVVAGLIQRQKTDLEQANARERAAAELASQTIEDMTSEEALNFLETQKELRPEQRRFLEQALAYYRQYAVAEEAAGEVEQARKARACFRMGFLQHRLGMHSEACATYQQAQAAYERLAAEHAAVPDYRRDLARSHNNLGKLLAELGKRPAAEAEYRQAIALQEQLAAEFPTVPAYRRDLARSHNNLGLLLAELGKRPEAEAEYRRALALLERLAAAFPTVPAYRQLLAGSHSNLGLLLAELGRRPQAEAEYRRALALQKQLATDFPTVPEYRMSLAKKHNNLGNLLAELGKRPAAEAEYRQAIALQERLAAEFPTVLEYRQDLAKHLGNLGVLLAALGKGPAAEAEYRRALALREQLAADFPTVPAYHHDLATSHLNLGNLLAAMGKGPAAEAEYRRALALRGQLATDFPTVPEYRQALAGSHNNLGNLLRELGKRSEAEAEYRRALALQEQLTADFPSVPAYRQELAGSHHNLGLLLAAMGKGPAAEAEYRRALALQERLATDFPTVPEYRQALAGSHNNLGLLVEPLGRRREAESEYRRALALCEQLAADFPTVPEYRQNLAKNHNNLGNLLADLGKWPAAEAEYRRALALRGQLAADFPTIPEYRRDLAKSHNSLGVLLSDLGKRSEAEAEYRRALALCEQLVADFPTVPAYTVELGGSYCNFGKLVRDRGEPAASLDWYAKACAALRPVLDKEPRLVTARFFLRNAHGGRARALDRLGRYAEAVPDWEQALALNHEKPRDGWFRLQRAASLARAGQQAQATAAVDEVLQRGNTNSGTLYDAACVYALAAAQAAKDAPPNTSSLGAEQYARRAMTLLRQAVQKGYKDAAHMKKDSDLDPLRQRADFQKLLQDLIALSK